MVRMISPTEEIVDIIGENFRTFVLIYLKHAKIAETDWLDHDEIAYRLTHNFTDLMWELEEEEKLEADADSS